MAKLVEKAKKVVEEKVANVKKPEAWVTDMDLADFCSDAITYTAKVAVKNPYSSPIPICQISYSFKSKGRLSSFTSLSLFLSIRSKLMSNWISYESNLIYIIIPTVYIVELVCNHLYKWLVKSIRYWYLHNWIFLSITVIFKITYWIFLSIN